VLRDACGDAASHFDDVSSRTSLAPIAGRYRLLQLLGEGAAGAVYLAEHIHMRKRCAVKVLHRDAATPEVLSRFRAEAIAAANIGHPGIAAARDFGVLDDGSLFLVLEFVAGESLAKVLARGPIPVRRALRIARNVLCALAAAHGKGIVHRDVKPANIMLCDGRASVKLLDFGIAHISRTDDRARFTRPGLIYGSADYMAPEQACGGAIDARADLYGVGAVLFEMISGRTPFVGNAIEVLAAHMSTPSPPLGGPEPRSLTRETHEVVARLLAKRPDDRPADAMKAVALIDAALVSLDRPKTRIAFPPYVRRPNRRAAIFAAAVLSSLALLTTIGIQHTRSRESVSIIGDHVRREVPVKIAPARKTVERRSLGATLRALFS